MRSKTLEELLEEIEEDEELLEAMDAIEMDEWLKAWSDAIDDGLLEDTEWTLDD